MARRTITFDPAAFVHDHLPLAPVEGLLGLFLHRATPQSGIGRLVGPGAPAPYWAYVWAGRLALAHLVRCFPQLIKGRVVMDLGEGSGLVGIVAAQAGAAQAGAASVIAADIDPVARVVTALNAEANGIQVEVGEDDYLSHPKRIGATGAEVILAGDLFHDSALAR